ncbi:hypothetical protein BKK49_06655 [Rodentibacter rarus]|uniref:Uncharacterized protein n=1 Tax=Rodentibacter rarus TaxID=1908260 RepID=A0A1V3IKR5_9PAST|nr:hypothetical protein BKK49_06655 [Rodentibacter rarus]OOF42257.1 hypothetical protein BKK50_07160 [Rodentibacter rarus]
MFMSKNFYRKLRKSTPWMDLLTSHNPKSKVPPLTEEELKETCQFTDEKGNVVYDLPHEYRRYKHRLKSDNTSV